MQYCLDAACCCKIGCKRKNNEDNFCFEGYILPQENKGLEKTLTAQVRSMKKAVSFGVFDGMGGEEYGQVAAFLAADTFKNRCAESNNCREISKKFLENAVMQMNDVVWKEADSRYVHMGTTAAILQFCRNGVYVCNVGDSKIFRLHQDELSQISEVHTDAKFLAECGIHNRKPRLSQYIGISPDEMIIEPYIAKKKLCLGDQYLICSDGLTDMVPDDEIYRIMKENPLAENCAEHLIGAALEHGGRDNVTVIVVKIGS